MSFQDELLEQELTDTLTIEYRKRGQVRCAALISRDSLELRSGQQHSRRCLRAGVQQEGDRMFCRQHAPLWRTHYEILERIMEIPPRA